MEVSDYSVLRPLYPRDKKIRCPLNKTLVGAADEAWAFMENKKKWFVPTGIQTLDSPTRNQGTVKEWWQSTVTSFAMSVRT